MAGGGGELHNCLNDSARRKQSGGFKTDSFVMDTSEGDRVGGMKKSTRDMVRSGSLNQALLAHLKENSSDLL